MEKREHWGMNKSEPSTRRFIWTSDPYKRPERIPVWKRWEIQVTETEQDLCHEIPLPLLQLSWSWTCSTSFLWVWHGSRLFLQKIPVPITIVTFNVIIEINFIASHCRDVVQLWPMRFGNKLCTAMKAWVISCYPLIYCFQISSTWMLDYNDWF